MLSWEALELPVCCVKAWMRWPAITSRTWRPQVQPRRSAAKGLGCGIGTPSSGQNHSVQPGLLKVFVGQALHTRACLQDASPAHQRT
jgi:hypothetical protein